MRTFLWTIILSLLTWQVASADSGTYRKIVDRCNQLYKSGAKGVKPHVKKTEQLADGSFKFQVFCGGETDDGNYSKSSYTVTLTPNQVLDLYNKSQGSAKGSVSVDVGTDFDFNTDVDSSLDLNGKVVTFDNSFNAIAKFELPSKLRNKIYYNGYSGKDAIRAACRGGKQNTKACERLISKWFSLYASYKDGTKRKDTRANADFQGGGDGKYKYLITVTRSKRYRKRHKHCAHGDSDCEDIVLKREKDGDCKDCALRAAAKAQMWGQIGSSLINVAGGLLGTHMRTRSRERIAGQYLSSNERINEMYAKECTAQLNNYLTYNKENMLLRNHPGVTFKEYDDYDCPQAIGARAGFAGAGGFIGGVGGGFFNPYQAGGFSARYLAGLQGPYAGLGLGGGGGFPGGVGPVQCFMPPCPGGGFGGGLGFPRGGIGFNAGIGLQRPGGLILDPRAPSPLAGGQSIGGGFFPSGIGGGLGIGVGAGFGIPGMTAGQMGIPGLYGQTGGYYQTGNPFGTGFGQTYQGPNAYLQGYNNGFDRVLGQQASLNNYFNASQGALGGAGYLRGGYSYNPYYAPGGNFMNPGLNAGMYLPSPQIQGGLNFRLGF